MLPILSILSKMSGFVKIRPFCFRFSIFYLFCGTNKNLHFLKIVLFLTTFSDFCCIYSMQEKLLSEHFFFVFRQQSICFMPVLRLVLYLILHF